MTDLERIKSLLRDENLTDVSRRTGLGYNTVRKVASGDDKISLATLRKLEGYFGDSE